MKGGKRARSGPAALPILTHIQRGTYRPDRHGPLDGVADPPAEWRPSAADLDRLGQSGRALVERVLRDYQLGLVDGLRLIETGEIADTIARLRALDRVGLLPAEVAAADRSELGWRQLFARHLDALGIVR